MLARQLWIWLLMCAGMQLPGVALAQDDDWRVLSEDVPGGGSVEFEYPESWGKKPEVEKLENATGIRFGPYGPPKKPIFLVHIEAVPLSGQIKEADLKLAAEAAVVEQEAYAAEASISINDLRGEQVAGHYFSVTDRESKRGEFDYLTFAILGSGRLAVKIYFFSSDGAPDFGADAMQMMRSVRYVAPTPKPEKGKK